MDEYPFSSALPLGFLALLLGTVVVSAALPVLAWRCARSRWQISLRACLLITAAFAVVCSVVAAPIRAVLAEVEDPLAIMAASAVFALLAVTVSTAITWALHDRRSQGKKPSSSAGTPGLVQDEARDCRGNL